MAVPRRARPARRPRPPRQAGTYATTTGAVGGGELVQAAEEIADGARDRARAWSRSVPPSIRTEQQDEKSVTIVADAPPAYPAETRARHPLFAQGERGAPGSRGWDHWYGPPGEPFLRPAADERAGAAMAKYAKKIDRLAREAGFE